LNCSVALQKGHQDPDLPHGLFLLRLRYPRTGHQSADPKHELAPPHDTTPNTHNLSVSSFWAQSKRSNVRSGSISTETRCPRHVRYSPLAGFVLIPFGLFGKSAFMAERVLGNVISSGIKVLVLAVIVGIGSTLFSQFTTGMAGTQPSIDDAMAMVLAALSLLGLGIFGPGPIATELRTLLHVSNVP
jgi:hypothetical protein